MAYRQGNRDQHTWLPAGIEDYVPADAQARIQKVIVSYYAGSVCRTCRHFDGCTTNQLQGRKVRRYEYEAL